MARQHGKKVYLQILLDPFRAELFEKLAEERGLKRTSLIRQIIYEWTAKQAGSTLYKKAANLDERLWAESVQNRIEGRKKAAAKRKKAKKAAPVPAVVVTPDPEPVKEVQTVLDTEPTAFKDTSLLGAIGRLFGN